jgi:hypothetical protein
MRCADIRARPCGQLLGRARSAGGGVFSRLKQLRARLRQFIVCEPQRSLPVYADRIEICKRRGREVERLLRCGDRVEVRIALKRCAPRFEQIRPVSLPGCQQTEF